MHSSVRNELLLHLECWVMKINCSCHGTESATLLELSVLYHLLVCRVCSSSHAYGHWVVHWTLMAVLGSTSSSEGCLRRNFLKLWRKTLGCQWMWNHPSNHTYSWFQFKASCMTTASLKRSGIRMRKFETQLNPLLHDVSCTADNYSAYQKAVVVKVKGTLYRLLTMLLFCMYQKLPQ